MATSAAEKRRLSALPDDLLLTVYARLAGPADRVRYAAVCAPWRAVVTHPPRLPWLILDPSGRDKEKHVYGLADGVILPRFSFPADAVGGRFVGGHGGGWAAFLDDEQLRIVNLFSGAEVALSPTQRTRCARDPFVPQKVVIFSEPPTLSGCILAAITNKYGVAIRGLGRSERAWRSRTYTTREVMDIAFCNGDLYCIMSCTKQIVKFEVGLDERGFAVFKSDPQWLVIHNQWDMDRLYLGAEGDPDAHAIYIVELRGKLVMAVRRTGGPRLCSRNVSDPFFLVFELVEADVNGAPPHCWYKWKEVRSLGDQALFLGPTCSKAMHLSTTECDGLRRNHIYYSHRRCYTRKERLPDDTKEFLTSSNVDGPHVYFKEDERVDEDVEGITSVGYYVVSGAQAHPPMWVLPPDV